MKIDITKEQYKELVAMIAIANGIVGVLGDVLTEGGYKKRSEKMTNLENYFLQFADDFDCNELMQNNDEYYENKISPIITDFEEYAVHDTLSNKLAWRDFHREHSEKEIKEMVEKNGDYFGVVLYDYEKKYWDEFEKNGFDRLEILKDNIFILNDKK